LLFIAIDEQKPIILKNIASQQYQINKSWHEKTTKVLYWLLVDVSNFMIMHVLDAKSS
jgi:hypothetical protein